MSEMFVSWKISIGTFQIAWDIVVAFPYICRALFPVKFDKTRNMLTKLTCTFFKSRPYNALKNIKSGLGIATSIIIAFMTCNIEVIVTRKLQSKTPQAPGGVGGSI